MISLHYGSEEYTPGHYIYNAGTVIDFIIANVLDLVKSMAFVTL